MYIKKLLFVIIAVFAITGYASASNMSVQTKIYDANSQPPIVGGVIDNDHFDIKFGRSTPKNVGAYTIIVTGKANTFNSFNCLLFINSGIMQSVVQKYIQSISFLIVGIRQTIIQSL